MAILEEKVEIEITSRNVTHFEKLGYEIPKVKRKWGMSVPQGTKIKVKTKDLSKCSKVRLTKICDECGEHKPTSFQVILRSRENSDGKDRCDKCARAYGARTQKENPPYEKSLEYYALNNDKEYLLLEFSDNNIQKPKNISYGSGEEYLWNCPKCKNEYPLMVYLRTSNGCNCPFCTNGNKRILKGFNDLWKTHPHVAQLLKDEQRGYEVTAKSGKKEEFVCSRCGFEKKTPVSSVTSYGFSCPRCSDGVSYPEKFTFEFLSQLPIEFEFQKTFDWSKNIPHSNPKLKGTKRYDFYILSRNVIIETHGKQHFEKGHFGDSSRTLEEEQENDELKKNLAKGNGIEDRNYVVLDCRESTIEHIQKSLFSSHLATMFDLEAINWLKCHEFGCNNLVETVCELWEEGNGIIEICEKVKLSDITTRRYLKQGKELGWCDYTFGEARRRGSIIVGKKRRKEIVQLSMDGEFIRYWEFISQASEVLGITLSNITLTCKGKYNHAGGYKWMYKDEYEANNNTLINETKDKTKRSIVKLDTYGKFIKEYSSITDAANEIGKDSSTISKNCKGKTSLAYGFKWMYMEDYEANNAPLSYEIKYKGKRTIVKLDLNGKFIKEYSSIKDAENEIGKNRSNISACCNGVRNKAEGFKWMYKEDYEGLLE
ncbi:zinc-ribbon domain-containing protein [Neobacillus sp. SuZ13]|uniref:zinc-ribbon domain-containing protein n=1 Tax=Neobacillus sp. SuZ13 TaxID=3047875 RepID=UPI0024BFD7C0|nr:zinc-ribbon domain-containing protein [Neobacillus sp. SuZ13]WHY64690.1 zinc-ribbon domain-containing protein [Neobacillus sp. SuZ13]